MQVVQNSVAVVAIANAMVKSMGLNGSVTHMGASDWYERGGPMVDVTVVWYETNMGEMACFTVYNNGVEVAEITLR
jgi:hypothetical protein